MAKNTKQRKADAKAVADARRLTPAKVLRLVLKSLGFAILVSLLLILLQSFNVPVFQTWWLQFGVMLVVYVAAYPFLMSEFRPKRGERSGGR